VQFHWDREGQNDEKSSCWIRVAQIWAGKTWGAVMLPRIGQEVIVEFLNGDPDQPIVTGRVYNGDNKPPYSLPANQTQSGIKSRSTKNGTGETFNELRFEDKKGEEQIYFHAEKDFERYVEDADELTVDAGDRTVTLNQGNETIALKQGNRTTTLEMGNDELTLKMGNLTTKLDLGKSDTQAMQSIELKVGQSSVKVDQMGVTIKGLMVKIEGTTMTDLKGLMTTVNGSAMLKLGGGITMMG
jgi:type VI secretion system secreted protein VgrG